MNESEEANGDPSIQKMRSEVFIRLLAVGSFSDIGNRIQEFYQDWCLQEPEERARLYFCVKECMHHSHVLNYELMVMAFRSWDEAQNLYGAPGWESASASDYFISRKRTEEIIRFVASFRDLKENGFIRRPPFRRRPGPFDSSESRDIEQADENDHETLPTRSTPTIDLCKRPSKESLPRGIETDSTIKLSSPTKLDMKGVSEEPSIMDLKASTRDNGYNSLGKVFVTSEKQLETNIKDTPGNTDREYEENALSDHSLTDSIDAKFDSAEAGSSLSSNASTGSICSEIEDKNSTAEDVPPQNEDNKSPTDTSCCNPSDIHDDVEGEDMVQTRIPLNIDDDTSGENEFIRIVSMLSLLDKE